MSYEINKSERYNQIVYLGAGGLEQEILNHTTEWHLVEGDQSKAKALVKRYAEMGNVTVHTRSEEAHV